MRERQIPYLFVQSLWYVLDGLVVNGPRTSVLNMLKVGALRVDSGRRFQARVVEGKYELNVDVRRVWGGLSGCVWRR